MEKLYTLSDLIETETNEFNIYINGVFYEYVKLTENTAKEDNNCYYETNTIDNSNLYSFEIGDNESTYLDYLHENIEDNQVNGKFLIGLGMINPAFIIKLIDNEKIIKGLLTYSTIVIDCGIFNLEITPIRE